ncbi:MAG: hypothetical protein JWM10_277 [Myxococcaceae bacterium]|nr:hypothetical protein [Myxococcaceae bacterium]
MFNTQGGARARASGGAVARARARVGLALLRAMLLVLAAGGCAVEEAAATGTAAQPSVVRTDNGWATNAIPVCWFNPTPADQADRAQIQQAVTAEFGTRTRINLTGWGACPPLFDIRGFAPLAVRIRIADERPSSQVGPAWANWTMTLNTTYQAFAKDQKGTRMIWDALHEMGHATGLWHEQDRPDSPCRSQPVDEGGRAGIIGPYDPASLMNYCGPVRTTMSAGDALALKGLFGATGKFVQEGNAIYRYTRPQRGDPAGTRCHVVNPTQLDAFGGARLIGQSLWSDWSTAGARDVGECVWPDGFYQSAFAVYYATGLDGAAPSYCWVESPEQLASMLGPFAPLPASGFGTGRAYTGRCAWADGFYLAAGDPAVYRVTGGTYCWVRDPEDQALLGGFGIVRRVPSTATFRAGRTFDGVCPVGQFIVTNRAIGDFATWAAAAGARAVAGDFDRDGLTDIALTGGPGWNTLPVAFSLGDGTFRVTNAFVGEFASWAQTAGARPVAGDFDGDGRSDVALVGGVGWNTQPVAFSLGDGTFRVTNVFVGEFASWATNAGAQAVAGDFDHDGDADLALAGGRGWTTVPIARSSRTGAFVVANRPAGIFAAWAQEPGARVLAGDFNDDDYTDLALTGPAGWNTLPVAFLQPGLAFQITNQGVGAFATWATQGAQAVVGDFDGDGRDDVALTGGGPGWLTLPVAFAQGGGDFNVENDFVPYVRSWSTEPGVQALAGRFNRDARADIALTGRAGWATVPVAFRR